MPYPSLETPVPGLEAFRRSDPAAMLSQAAILLLLGSDLRGDAAKLRAHAAAGTQDLFIHVPEEDRKLLDPPPVSFSGKRVSSKQTWESIGKRYDRALLRQAPERQSGPLFGHALADVAERLYAEPREQVFAELVEICLAHPDPLPRIAAAATCYDLSDETRRPILILAEGTRSADTLISDLAATGLAQINPEHPVLAHLTGPEPTAPSQAEEAHTSLLVHGTWARQRSWWRPGGDFHNYLLANVRSDLYSGSTPFSWSGSYVQGHAGHALGALQLLQWVDRHNANGLDIFAHSHGGNVAMLASQGMLNIGKLVLLSCPVHVPQYLPNFNRVGATVSIRVHFDLVIALDRGGQRFHHPQIHEHVLPNWFLGHSDTHEPAVWMKYKVPGKLGRP